MGGKVKCTMENFFVALNFVSKNCRVNVFYVSKLLKRFHKEKPTIFSQRNISDWIYSFSKRDKQIKNENFGNLH